MARLKRLGNELGSLTQQSNCSQSLSAINYQQRQSISSGFKRERGRERERGPEEVLVKRSLLKRTPNVTRVILRSLNKKSFLNTGN